jgi:hypothetical protein
MRHRIYIYTGLVIALLTLAGYALFPGHTYLQSDTQIYVPMLERLWNPAVLERDFMVQRPHMAFTIYDEVAVALRRWTGWSFQEVLTFQQLLFRALGILGVYLLARSFQLGARMSLLVAGILSLGATIWGPTVLTVEYEPVPRGFALPLLLLALGLLARGWHLAAGAVASLAFLYQGMTTVPFWLCYGCLLAWPAPPRLRLRRALALLPLLAAALGMFVFARLQPGPAQPLFPLERLEPWWEQVLRLRSTYIWVSLWFPRWYWHYLLLWTVAAAAVWRLRLRASPELFVPLAGLPLAGILSLPVSYWLLEVSKSAMGPQLQPARAVLFVTAMATLLASVAGIRAAQSGRPVEAFCWLVIAFAVPTGNAIQHILLPDLRDPVIVRRVLLVMLLAAGAAAVAWIDRRKRRWILPVWAVLMAAPFLLYPAFGKVQNYPALDRADVHELARWARSGTPQDAVFLFPDAGRELYPGVFRAAALRAVYVDWKGGGQSNYLKDVAREWWERWQAVMAPGFRAGHLGRFAGRGIDYVAVKRANRPPGETPVFENPSFSVYRIR